MHRFILANAAKAWAHRDTDTEMHISTETQRQRDTDTLRHRYTEIQMHREADTQRDRGTETYNSMALVRLGSVGFKHRCYEPLCASVGSALIGLGSVRIGSSRHAPCTTYLEAFALHHHEIQCFFND